MIFLKIDWLLQDLMETRWKTIHKHTEFILKGQYSNRIWFVAQNTRNSSVWGDFSCFGSIYLYYNGLNWNELQNCFDS